jgi:hypothetical protein
MSVIAWLRRLLGLAERIEKRVESSVRPPPLDEPPELGPISLSPRAIIKQRLPPPRPPRKD